ncbi:MAG: filamentous hemagglutinin N-terminal domain-containing protein, partial [Bacillota bacterium]
MLIKKYSNSLSKTIAAATKKGAAACLALCLLSPTAAEATPQNGNIVGGQGVIEQTSPVDMKITQTTARMAIDWNAFDIGANEKVTFLQPGSDSAVLNRVTGGGASLIAGKLNANGSIYFVNPNGINFAAGSAVEAGSMLATTGNVDPLNFMQGLVNIGAGNSIIVNSGAITANNGSVQLIGATEIQNNGTIMSRTVADGGVVILSASNIISNSGKIDASATSKGKGGSVIITSDGVVNLSNGSIYANGGIVSGAGGNLSITAKGNISQSADSGIFLGKGGTGSFDAGTGDVVLNSKNNSFDGTIKITGNNVDLFSKTGYVIGTNKISGNLTLGTEMGAVTQNTAILLKTGKTATLNAGKGSISLIEPRNKLSKIIANGGNVAVRSDSTINMGASNVTGQLSL